MTPRRLHQLEAFRAVIHSGSVTRAAEMLALSQPAVTKLLRALEDETGLALFDRAHRRLTPTHEAQRFLHEVELFFAAAKRVDRLANDMRGSGMGELHVAALPSFGSAFVPRLLARFRKTEQQMRISVTVASSLEVHDLVQSRQADLGFALPVAASGMATAAPGIDLPGMLVLPRRHALAKRQSVPLEALNGQPYVALGRQYRLRDLVDDLFERHGVAPQPVGETQNAAAACAMVAEGAGFAVVDAVTAIEFVDRLAVRELRPSVTFPVQVLAPPGRRMSLLAERFLALVRHEVSALVMPGSE